MDQFLKYLIITAMGISALLIVCALGLFVILMLADRSADAMMQLPPAACAVAAFLLGGWTLRRLKKN